MQNRNIETFTDKIMNELNEIFQQESVSAYEATVVFMKLFSQIVVATNMSRDDLKKTLKNLKAVYTQTKEKMRHENKNFEKIER